MTPCSVADFYAEVMQRLRALGVDVHHLDHAVAKSKAPFRSNATVNTALTTRDAAQRFWRQLVQADRVMNVFRGRFLGKCSPVHFFWGSFDLAVSAVFRPHRAAACEP